MTPEHNEGTATHPSVVQMEAESCWKFVKSFYKDLELPPELTRQLEELRAKYVGILDSAIPYMRAEIVSQEPPCRAVGDIDMFILGYMARCKAIETLDPVENGHVCEEIFHDFQNEVLEILYNNIDAVLALVEQQTEPKYQDIMTSRFTTEKVTPALFAIIMKHFVDQKTPMKDNMMQPIPEETLSLLRRINIVGENKPFTEADIEHLHQRIKKIHHQMVALGLLIFLLAPEIGNILSILFLRLFSSSHHDIQVFEPIKGLLSRIIIAFPTYSICREFGKRLLFQSETDARLSIVATYARQAIRILQGERHEAIEKELGFVPSEFLQEVEQLQELLDGIETLDRTTFYRAIAKWHNMLNAVRNLIDTPDESRESDPLLN